MAPNILPRAIVLSAVVTLTIVRVLFVLFIPDVKTAVHDFKNTHDDCQDTFQNSPEWLSGRRRLGNANVSQDSLYDLIINASPETSELKLKSTICHETSRFIQQEHNRSSLIDEQWKDFTFRLTYLAIHEHQHRHARNEALSRIRCGHSHGNNSTGNFDYECPDAKFLISNVPSEGVGASLRYGAVSALLLGLGTDRVVLFLDSVPWKAASCNRQDLQCFFMPTSPCVITEEDFANAPMMNSADIILQKDEYEKNKNERIIRVQSSAAQRSNLQLPTVKSAILDTIRSLYNDTSSDKSVVDGMMTKIETYIGKWTVDHAATLYVMRPNDVYQERMKHRMNELFSKEFQPANAIGLPIRGACEASTLSVCKRRCPCTITYCDSPANVNFKHSLG